MVTLNWMSTFSIWMSPTVPNSWGDSHSHWQPNVLDLLSWNLSYCLSSTQWWHSSNILENQSEPALEKPRADRRSLYFLPTLRNDDDYPNACHWTRWPLGVFWLLYSVAFLIRNFRKTGSIGCSHVKKKKRKTVSRGIAAGIFRAHPLINQLINCEYISWGLYLCGCLCEYVHVCIYIGAFPHKQSILLFEAWSPLVDLELDY